MSIKPNVLYQADCLALLERMESDQVNLVYLDPPWFTDDDLVDSQGAPDEGFQQYFDFLAKVFQQVQRTCYHGVLSTIPCRPSWCIM